MPCWLLVGSRIADCGRGEREKVVEEVEKVVVEFLFFSLERVRVAKKGRGFFSLRSIPSFSKPTCVESFITHATAKLSTR